MVLLMFVEAAFALAVLGTWALLPREPKVPPSHSHLESTMGRLGRGSVASLDLDLRIYGTFTGVLWECLMSKRYEQFSP